MDILDKLAAATPEQIAEIRAILGQATTRVAIYGPNLPSAMQRVAGFHIHAADCGDCAKLDRDPLIEDAWHIDATDRRDVAGEIYADHIDEGSMTLDDALGDCHFCPCLKGLPA